MPDAPLSSQGDATRVDVAPDTGLVVIAHPRYENDAAAMAEREGCAYMLRDFIPMGSVYLVDMDLVGDRWDESTFWTETWR